MARPRSTEVRPIRSSPSGDCPMRKNRSNAKRPAQSQAMITTCSVHDKDAYTHAHRMPDSAWLGLARRMLLYLGMTTKLKPIRIRLVCNECGKRWSVGPNHPGPQCPKCNSVDWNVV